jgi:hypothetical protein
MREEAINQIFQLQSVLTKKLIAVLSGTFVLTVRFSWS